MHSAIVVDDEESIRFSLKRFLGAEGYAVTTAESYEDAIEKMDEIDFDLVFTDILLGGKTGLDLLRAVRKRKLTCPVVVFTGIPSLKTAVEAVRLGAFDYIEKPLRQKELLQVAKAALQKKQDWDQKEKMFSNLQQTFDNVKDAIITVNHNMSILEINGAASEICGISRKQFVGRLLTDSVNQCSGKCMEIFQETIKKGAETEAYRVHCNRKNHPEQVVSITTSPLPGFQQEGSGGVMVIRDETPQVKTGAHLDVCSFQNIVGKSRMMQGIYARIKALADVRTTVLITGSSGTGKEVVADAIHFSGCRRDKAFVKVNCAALPEGLLESELFGHVAGAFTGAIRDKIGWFQKANGGTIFLDEIGEMSNNMQLRLLRVLQTMEFERLGDPTTIRVDVRVLAATNKDLKQEVACGRFRDDLYYRLKVIGISLPPLKDRREDIPLLISHFLKKFSKMFDKEIVGVVDEVQQIFMKYPWPGNVRELMHAIEHAFVLCSGRIILVHHLAEEFQSLDFQQKKSGEYEEILTALRKSRWNKTLAANRIGISRQGLYRKMKKYNILDS